MAEIKSAYEKALERFSNVKPDKDALHRKNLIEQGRQMCARILQGEKISIVEYLESQSEETKEFAREGIGEALLAQIALPSSEHAISQIDIIKAIVLEISPQKTVAEQLIMQYKDVCQQYFEQKTDLKQQLQARYMEYVQQHGQQNQSVEMNFLQSMQQQLKRLDEQYDSTIQQFKVNIRKVCGFDVEK